MDFVLRSVKQSQQQNDRSHSRKEIRTLDTFLREKSDGLRRVSRKIQGIIEYVWRGRAAEVSGVSEAQQGWSNARGNGGWDIME